MSGREMKNREEGWTNLAVMIENEQLHRGS